MYGVRHVLNESLPSWLNNFRFNLPQSSRNPKTPNDACILHPNKIYREGQPSILWPPAYAIAFKNCQNLFLPTVGTSSPISTNAHSLCN